MLKAEIPMTENRRFERISKIVACKSYTKQEDVPENEEIFFYGFKHIKSDIIINYIIFGCESDELSENDKLSNFWSNKFINKEIEMRTFNITGWSFMTLVKRNNFFKIQSICYKTRSHKYTNKKMCLSTVYNMSLTFHV